MASEDAIQEASRAAAQAGEERAAEAEVRAERAEAETAVLRCSVEELGGALTVAHGELDALRGSSQRARGATATEKERAEAVERQVGRLEAERAASNSAAGVLRAELREAQRAGAHAVESVQAELVGLPAAVPMMVGPMMPSARVHVRRWRRSMPWLRSACVRPRRRQRGARRREQRRRGSCASCGRGCR
eukprot:COSAG01_NODE_1397_length_10467_cov_9.010706_10_plen_190_part_00